jgi:DUF4097 and DUF4098 domain-containing protein YvlB
MKQFLFTSVLGLVGWGLACAQTQSPITRDGAYWVRTIHGTIDTASSERLRVETTGNVTLRGASADSGGYTLEVRVKTSSEREAERQLDRIIVKTGAEGGRAYLRVTPPNLVSSRIELSVTGPRSLRQVSAETRGGNMQASDWDGDVVAQTAGGRIAVDRIHGSSELRTAGGDIEIGTVVGPVRCSSGGGMIRVDTAGAAVTLETAGGEIVVRQADGPVQATTGGGNIRIEKAGSTVMARTAGGMIQVQQADGPVTAESSGGAIQVNSAKGVRCESAGGAIRLRNAAGPVRAFANSGSILVELLPGSANSMADSILSTNAGDITVLIPSNLALRVQAINESGGSGRINSDFPQVHLRSGKAADVGPLVAEGSLNGGGPLLRLNVMAGSIYLQRAK